MGGPGKVKTKLEQNIAWNMWMERVKKFDLTPETEIEYQPGIMLGTLELALSFDKR